MKPFGYRAPSSLQEAAMLLSNQDLRVQAMAGGTDLLVQLRAGRFDLDLIVDIKHIPDTNQLVYDPVEGLTIGAAVPCWRIYENRQIQDLYPAIVDSASLIGGVAVQGRATFGGNVCNASPSGDSLPTLIVLEAVCRIFGPHGERVVPSGKVLYRSGGPCAGAGGTARLNKSTATKAQLRRPLPAIHSPQ